MPGSMSTIKRPFTRPGLFSTAMTRAGAKGEVGDSSSGTGPYRARSLTVLALLTGLAANVMLGLSSIDVSQRQLVETDGYMRYSRILDLVEGRNGWFDGWIHWSNSPFGHSMHWTRLLDGLVIALAAPLAPFIGWREAIYWAGLASGPLSHLALIAVVIWVARPFVSAPAAALAGWVVALQPLIVGYSYIGHLDHHLLLTALTMAVLGCTLRALHWDLSAATAAGCLAGLALWVSTEALLPVALAAITLVTWWVIVGGPLDALWRWASALAPTIVVVVFVEHGPGDLTAVEYDRISLPHLVLAVVGFVGMWVAVTLTRERSHLLLSRRSRLITLAACLAIPLLIVAAVFPGLRHGPFADTPQRIWDIWLSHVSELQPMWNESSPARALIVQIGTPVFGLVCAVALARRSLNRSTWIVIAIWLTILIPIAMNSLRFALYPEALAALPVAAVVWGLILRFGQGSSVRRVLTRLGLVIMVVFGHLVLGALAVSTPAVDESINDECHVRALAPLIESNVAEDEAILAHIDLGPVLHDTTGRNVIATPHHRNVDGILAAYDVMRSTPEDALLVIEQRRIGAVVMCSREDRIYLDPVPPRSLAHDLIDGSPPSWLTKVASDDSEATLYLVRP